MRLVVLLCLASGALLDAAEGACNGKGGDEQTLFRGLLGNLEAGDVLLGDAYFPTYFLLCALAHLGVDGVFEQYGARRRSTDCSLGQRLGTKDHRIVWTKPKRPLGMEALRCRTAEMARKELWAYLLAYNLIRLLMAQAALLADQVPRQLRFKHTVQVWISWHARGCASHDGVVIYGLLLLIAPSHASAADRRPGRIEPRQRKCRPKSFPLMTKPRSEAREEVRLNGHPKKQK
jgi:hypothetical protein